MKDLMQELTMVQRRVSDGGVPAGLAKVVTLSRTYAAPVADVWDALTDPERLSRWFLPVSGDLRLGGRYAFEGNAGGVIRECEEPHRIVVTWEMGEPGPADTSLVEVRLAESGGGTRLDLEHRAQMPPQMWDEFGPGAVGVGWELGLLGLTLHLRTGEGVDDPEAFMTSPEAADFMRRSAAQWGAARTAPDALERAERTSSFYAPG